MTINNLSFKVYSNTRYNEAKRFHKAWTIVLATHKINYIPINIIILQL